MEVLIKTNVSDFQKCLHSFNSIYSKFFHLELLFSYILISEQLNDIMLLHNTIFIMFVLNPVWQFHHTYVHLKGKNNIFIRLVLHIYWQFHHTYVHLKISKSIFHFIRNISYISKIHFVFNHSYFHYYSLLYFYLDLIGHFEFQFLIMSILIFYVYDSKFHIIYAISINIIFLVLIVTYSHPIMVSIFPSQHNGVASPSLLLIVIFCRLSLFPHLPQVRPLVGFTD